MIFGEPFQHKESLKNILENMKKTPKNNKQHDSVSGMMKICHRMRKNIISFLCINLAHLMLQEAASVLQKEEEHSSRYGRGLIGLHDILDILCSAFLHKSMYLNN